MEDGPKIGRDLTFFSAWYCPFAQRTWIAMEEKKLTFKLREVNLKHSQTGLWRQLHEKPAWFTQLSPLGKVPCLAYRDEQGQVHSVYESLICNEFLEDFASPPVYPALFPQNPAEKARARMLIERIERKFIPNFYGMLCKPPKLQLKCRDALIEELVWLEGQMHSTGPFFMGSQFSAVDCAILPWFLRLYILKHYRSFQMPKTCRRLVAWYSAAMSRDSVQATLRCPDPNMEYEALLLEHYSRYADGTANSSTAREFGGLD